MQLNQLTAQHVKKYSVKTLVFLSLSAIFFGALNYYIAFSGKEFNNEIGHHLQFAQKMEESGHILVPHFLFHAIAIVAHKIVLWLAPDLALLRNDPYVDN